MRQTQNSRLRRLKIRALKKPQNRILQAATNEDFFIIVNNLSIVFLIHRSVVWFIKWWKVSIFKVEFQVEFQGAAGFVTCTNFETQSLRVKDDVIEQLKEFLQEEKKYLRHKVPGCEQDSTWNMNF